MGYLSFNGFLFNGGGFSRGDGYFNPCVPATVGLGNRVPVTVRVRQGVTVDQPANQPTNQPENLVVITIQQSTIWLPSQQAASNPVRAHQPASAGEEIPLSRIPILGDRALEEFNRQEESAGTTLLLPAAAGSANQLAQANQVVRSLGKEVGAQAAASLQLADEAAASAAGSTVDDAARLAGKLKGLSPAAIQQALQKTGLSFNQARDVANAVATNADEAAAALRQLGFSKINDINRQITTQATRIAAQVC